MTTHTGSTVAWFQRLPYRKYCSLVSNFDFCYIIKFFTTTIISILYQGDYPYRKYCGLVSETKYCSLVSNFDFSVLLNSLQLQKYRSSIRMTIHTGNMVAWFQRLPCRKYCSLVSNFDFSCIIKFFTTTIILILWQGSYPYRKYWAWFQNLIFPVLLNYSQPQ